jgi:hypothetical protein
MDSEYAAALRALEQAGWQIIRSEKRLTLPLNIQSRYDWVPSSHRGLIEEVELAHSPDDAAWLVTAADLAGTSGTTFRWNEWEKQSLRAAREDESWRRHITQFWDAHFPVIMTLRSGYAYFALERVSLNIVYGCEPEFEAVISIASSTPELLRLLAVRDARVAHLI